MAKTELLLLSILIFIVSSNHYGIAPTSAFSPTALSPRTRRITNVAPFVPRGILSPNVRTSLRKDNDNNHAFHSSRQMSRVVVASSPSRQQQGGDTSTDTDIAEDPESKKASRRRIINLHIWVILMSVFIIKNAKGSHPYPAFLLSALNRPQWALVHAICAMLFSGTILLSALIEYLVVASEKATVIKFWFLSIPGRLDSKVVLPALTGAVVSGVGQAAIDYGGLATSPKHIVGAFHLLVTFGLWWGITDVTSQRASVKAVQQLDEDVSNIGDDDTLVIVPKVLKRRLISNIVSSLFVMAMYALMVLKPGFGN